MLQFFMFIEVVHANGVYSPKTGSHKLFMRDESQGHIGEAVSRALDGGATVLYKPNLVYACSQVIGDSDEEARVLSSDPFYMSLPVEH